jgi:hypothetical protein
MLTKTFFQHSKTIIFSALFLFLFNHASAQPPAPTLSAFDYLTQQEGASITLELDLTDLINSKNTNQYFPGSLTSAEGKMLKVEVRPRGKFRRRICDIPPMKLKFSKKELRSKGMDTLNEIKLVVPCFSDPKGEELLLREYVAYRMFERLSPEYSVRARLVKITFRDKHVEGVKTPVYCMLVEHQEQVQARLHGKIVDEFGLKADSLNAEQAAMTALFQYMIGNTDWNVADMRNIYLFKSSPTAKIHLLPYDFDFAGLVDAPYAVPKAETGLKNVKERILLSNGIPNEAVKQAVEKIKSAQSDLFLFCNSSFLNKNTVKDLNRYMESFFQKIDSLPTEMGKAKGDLR